MFSSPFRPFALLLLAGVIGGLPLLAQENSELRFYHERGQTPIPVKNWAAPLYFQPSDEESAFIKRSIEESQTAAGANTSASSTFDPSVPLVFVATTPCRVMDTRGNGFTGFFGPPTMAAGSSRTVPIPTSPTCTIPTTALAYSFNVTVVPQGPLYYLSIWPAGQTQPTVSTLNDQTGLVLANAAIVPAGSSGGVDIYVTNITDVILDINGYYVPPNALALGAGTAGAPALTFSNDASSGVYSPSAGTIGITSGGNNILTVNSSGISTTGNITSTGVISGNGSGLTNVNAVTAAMAASATTATTATNFTGSLAGEVTGTQGATVVSNAVSTNTPNAVVRRDASGNFSAGTIALNLSNFSGTNVTVLDYTGIDSGTPTPTPALLRTIGSFTKAEAATSITTVWNATVNSVGTGFCQYQLRIDGNAPNSVLSDGSGAVNYGDAQAVSLQNYWTGLSTGSHTVSIWIRGSGTTSCAANEGNFDQYVYVTEQ